MSEGLWLAVVGGGFTLLGIVVSSIIAPRMQERSKALKDEADADRLTQERYDRLYRRYMALRETFERTRGDILRSIDIALVRLDSDKDSSRVSQILEALKHRIESLQLRSFDDDDSPKTP